MRGCNPKQNYFSLPYKLTVFITYMTRSRIVFLTDLSDGNWSGMNLHGFCMSYEFIWIVALLDVDLLMLSKTSCTFIFFYSLFHNDGKFDIENLKKDFFCLTDLEHCL